MAGVTRRITKANERFSENVTQRGNIQKKSQKSLPTSAYIIALFVFIVCGSAVFEVIRYIN